MDLNLCVCVFVCVLVMCNVAYLDLWIFIERTRFTITSTLRSARGSEATGKTRNN